ncbi:MAG TPA: response regulator [Rhodospirillales bacterium]|jgi:CheY-like chemotaxis protein
MARILVIEDDELVRISLRRALESQGHDVYEAADGEEGVSEFLAMVRHAQQTDVIVTDILMPKKDGYDTINEIREIMPEAKIVAMSGGGNVNPKVFLDISSYIGVNRVLAKPFSTEDLIEAVNDCLN